MERSEKVSLEKASAEGLMGTEPEISVSRAGGEVPVEEPPELRVGGGEEEPTRIGTERIKDRVEAHCMAVTERGVPCKSPASWALVQGELETLVCGTHLKKFEKSSKEIGRLEKLMDYGFNLKEKGDRAYVPTISRCRRKRGCK